MVERRVHQKEIMSPGKPLITDKDFLEYLNAVADVLNIAITEEYTPLLYKALIQRDLRCYKHMWE